MNITTVDAIIVILYFEYSRDERRVPADIREALLGLEERNRSSIWIPTEINQKIGKEVLKPHSFALIKEPEKKTVDGEKEVESVYRTRASGGLGVYLYMGPQEKVEKVCDEIKNLYKNRKNDHPFSKTYGIEIIAGKRYHYEWT